MLDRVVAIHKNFMPSADLIRVPFDDALGHACVGEAFTILMGVVPICTD